MKLVTLGEFGGAHVWLNEPCAAVFAPVGVLSASAPHGAIASVAKLVTLEVQLPRGARVDYGLLGLEFERRPAGISIEVPWCESLGPEWRTALVVPPDTVRVGLPNEYADAVLSSIERRVRGRFEPATIRLVAAAHGEIGSSPGLMSRIAGALIELAGARDASEEMVRRILSNTVGS